jgi:hypothetical protein
VGRRAGGVVASWRKQFHVFVTNCCFLEKATQKPLNHQSNSLINLLDHIKDGSVLVEPNIVVRDGHGLECDLLGVFEKRIWTPN